MGDCEALCWVGKGGAGGILRGEAVQERKSRKPTARKTPPPPSARSPPPPGRSKAFVDSEDDSDDSDDEKPRTEDPFKTLLSNSITSEQDKVKNTLKLIGVICNESLKDATPVKVVRKVSTDLPEYLRKEGVSNVTRKEDKNVEKGRGKDKDWEAGQERERKEKKEGVVERKGVKEEVNKERKEGKEERNEVK